jgi:hypothetical protein
VSEHWTAWTTGEISRLKLFYPVMPKKRLLREMHPRTWMAIYTKAKNLGIKRAPKRNWKFIAGNYKPVFFPSPHRVPSTKKEDAEAA